MDRFLSGGSPTGGRVGSREGGGSSTGGSSWDGGSLTGGRLRRGSLIGVFFRLFILSKTLLSQIEISRSTLAQSRWPIHWLVVGGKGRDGKKFAGTPRAGKWFIDGSIFFEI